MVERDSSVAFDVVPDTLIHEEYVEQHDEQRRVDGAHEVPPVGHAPRDEAEARAAEAGEDVPQARVHDAPLLRHRL